MRRLAASASVTGLALMSAVAFLLCASGVSLETRIVVFVSGVALFVSGSAGYTATEQRLTGPPLTGQATTEFRRRSA
jgi:hypothetical protein